MRILIESKNGQNLRLGFPTGLALNAGTLLVEVESGDGDTVRIFVE